MKLPFLPVLIAKAHLTRNEDILMILFKLATIENFPNKKVASILSRDGTRADDLSSCTLHKQFERCDIQTRTTKFLNGTLGVEIEELIERISVKLDNNEIANIKTTDVVQLYRQKINILNHHLTSVTSNLDQSTKQIAELHQKLASFRDVTEKQEFVNWCLQLDIERQTVELQNSTSVNQALKTSLGNFQAKLDKEETKKHDAQKSLKLQIKEIEGMISRHFIMLSIFSCGFFLLSAIRNAKLQSEQKVHELKTRLAVTQKENVS